MVLILILLVLLIWYIIYKDIAKLVLYLENYFIGYEMVLVSIKYSKTHITKDMYKNLLEKFDLYNLSFKIIEELYKNPLVNKKFKNKWFDINTFIFAEVYHHFIRHKDIQGLIYRYKLTKWELEIIRFIFKKIKLSTKRKIILPK